MRRKIQKYNQEVEVDYKVKVVISKWVARVLLLLKWSLIPPMNWKMQTNISNQIGISNTKFERRSMKLNIDYWMQRKIANVKMMILRWVNNNQ
jgi:hypothetical protein